MTQDIEVKPEAALDALESVEAMKIAGHRRAQLPRWYGVGIALIVLIGFSLYAQQEPGNSPGLFIALGLALFIGYSRNRIDVFGKELPDSKVV